MSFWSLDSIRAAAGGVWLARPDLAGNPVPVSGITGLSTDSRALTPGQAFLALKGEKHDGHAYLAQAAKAGSPLLIIDTPDALPAALPAGVCVLKVQDTGQALLRLAAAYRRELEPTKVIAVGGSNGKTTTVRLIQSILSAHLRGTCSPKSFNNAVGVPLTVLSARKGDAYLLCEVGTNAPGEIAPLAEVLRPDIAVITSIGREHLEGLGSIRGVIQEETSLLRSLSPGALAVINAESEELDAAVSAMASQTNIASLVRFGSSDRAEVRVERISSSFEGVSFTLNGRLELSLPLLGAHNALNAAAAFAVARRMGLSEVQIAEALRQVQGPPMRLERLSFAVPGGTIRVINDAYNANPESVLAAIRVFGELGASPAAGVRRRVVVLGDMLELGAAGPEAHREMGEALAQARCADLVILVGPLMLFAADRLRRVMPPEAVVLLESLDGPRAAAAAARLAPGDLVLLKGSRGMGLERLLVPLSSAAPARPHAAQPQPSV